MDSHGLEPGPLRCFVCFYGIWQSPTWQHGVATPKTTILSLKLLLARYHSDDETRGDKSVRAFSTSVGEMHRVQVGKPEGKKQLGRPRCSWTIILKTVLRQDKEAWHGCMRLRIRASDGLL